MTTLSSAPDMTAVTIIEWLYMLCCPVTAMTAVSWTGVSTVTGVTDVAAGTRDGALVKRRSDDPSHLHDAGSV